MQGQVDLPRKYSFIDAPSELEKKVTLLNHFRTFLNDKQPSKSRLGPDGDPLQEATPVYVKKVMNTSHCLIMRLNNHLTQVYFKDGTELFLQEKTKTITYINIEN